MLQIEFLQKYHSENDEPLLHQLMKKSHDQQYEMMVHLPEPVIQQMQWWNFQQRLRREERYS